MKQLLTTFFFTALFGTVPAAADDNSNSSDVFLIVRGNVIDTSHGALSLGFAAPMSVQGNSFIETYDDGTDVGLWHCSLGAPRIIEISGGNPGAYVQQGGFSTSIPTWASISTRFQPGVNDQYKVDSIYTGDWTGLGVTGISVDLNVIHVGDWATDRAVTLELLQMDDTGFNVNYDATYTLPDLPDPPIGWQTYSFPVDADSPVIPQGWVFTHGDGTPGTDAEWSPFLHRIDLTSIGFYKPGFGYPSLGTWTLGIDNVQIDFQPTPTPTPSATPSATPRATPIARPRPTPPARPSALSR
jgi:hypothetical protein